MKFVHFLLIGYVYFLLYRLFSKQQKKSYKFKDTDITYVLEKIPYYTNLHSDEARKKFITNTRLFLQHVQFVNKDTEISDSLKIYIAAHAAMVCFGLQQQLYNRIFRIIIGGDMYYSRLQKQHMKGFFHPKGFIYLSLPHLNQGIENPTDGTNLLLHELGHALDILLLRNKKFKFYFRELVYSWVQSSKDIKNNDSETSFFREYGIQNSHEFFAVAIENFFERPHEFSKKSPQIYEHMCFLLNQNPLGNAVPVYQINPAHMYEKPLLSEPVNTQKMVFLLFIFVAMIGLSYIIPNFISILLLGSIYSFRMFFDIFYAKRIRFYAQYIELEKVLFSRNRKIIPIRNIIYIAHFKHSNTIDTHLLSFVYFNGDIRETSDDFVYDDEFIAQIKTYTHEKNIVFIDKAINKEKTSQWKHDFKKL